MIEHLEPIAEIIQSNTDGILIKMPDGKDEDEFFQMVDDVTREWEQRTGLVLEFDEYRKVFQKDVNNYVIIDADGNYKSKGAYVKKLNELDYDLAIVNRALINFMIHGITVETTIKSCKSLREFQQVKKISSKYDCIRHGNKILNEKTVRCFASKIHSDGRLYKRHSKTGRFAKIEGTPENCFLVNGSVNNVSCPEQLNKQWYIEVAKKRLKDFGFNEV